jgi:hypothetical protein
MIACFFFPFSGKAKISIVEKLRGNIAGGSRGVCGVHTEIRNLNGKIITRKNALRIPEDK